MASESSAAEPVNQADSPFDVSDAGPNAIPPAITASHNDEEVARLVQQLPQLLDTAGEALKQLQREKGALAKEVRALERDVLVTGGGMVVAGVVFGIAVSFLGHEWMLKRMR